MYSFFKKLSYIPYKIRNIFIEKKLTSLNEEEKFSLIYKTRYWTGFNPSSLSGSGSNLDATENIRRELPDILTKYKINSLLDLPCGDFHWMSKINLNDIHYTGGDIVQSVVDANNEQFGNEKCHFLKINLLDDKLPQVDLIFTRDCFVHLTNDQVVKAIHNILASKSHYFMTTVFENVNENKSHSSGDRWRPINLTIEPFNLPEPIEIIDDSFENGQDMLKKMYLWDISLLTQLKSTEAL